MSIWTVLESEAYQFTFTTSSNDKEQYDQYKETAERIINSFWIYTLTIIIHSFLLKSIKIGLREKE